MQTQVIFTLVLTVLWSVPLPAGESPYSGLETREVKALSKQQVSDYLDGKGMGLALPGELNGYPGPKHVLDLADQLGLSSDQRKEVVQVFDAMRSQAISLGKRIVEAEAVLDTLFANGSIDSDSLKTTTSRIGLLQGQLRAVHLQAHIETKSLLTARQVHDYIKLRGYSSSGDSNMKHHGHSH